MAERSTKKRGGMINVWRESNISNSNGKGEAVGSTRGDALLGIKEGVCEEVEDNRGQI